MSHKYGVLKYSSQNIGDEIQSIAAMRFLPQIDYYIHRERIDEFQANDERVKLIMNGWWMWWPKHFPPSDDIIPLLTSIHIKEDIRDRFLKDKVKEYLIKNGPVGCRDMSTLQYLKENEVPAYFSGCLTLTLQGNKKLRRKGKYVLCVDAPKEVVEEVKRRTDYPVYDFTRMLTVSLNSVQRMELAKIVLSLYNTAHCVVTSRLHVCLPCIAFDTPVLLIKSDSVNRKGRFDGLTHMVNECTDTEFLENKKIYNFDKPKRNPQAHYEMRDNLIKTCTDFTGYDNRNSLFEDDYEPLISLIKMLNYDYDNVKRTLWFAKESDLLNVLYQKQVNGKNHHDVKY